MKKLIVLLAAIFIGLAAQKAFAYTVVVSGLPCHPVLKRVVYVEAPAVRPYWVRSWGWHPIVRRFREWRFRCF